MPCILSACDITSLYPVGIATIDRHRTLKRKKRQGYILLKTDTQSYDLSQVLEHQSNFWMYRDQGVWSNPHHLLQPSDSWWWTTIISVTCNVELRSQKTKLELLTILKTRLRTYVVSLIPAYAYTVLTRDRSIDRRLRPSLRSPTTFSAIHSIQSRKW